MTTPEPRQTFPASYVRALRQDVAKYRTRAREAAAQLEALRALVAGAPAPSSTTPPRSDG